MRMNPVALKEWASACRALEDGSQIMLMRKGGIHEETRRFELRSPSFYLFPTFEHQRSELVKDKDKPYVEQSMAEFGSGSETVRLTSYAEAAADLEVRDEQQLQRLYPFHIWNERLAGERLKWKAKEPLHILLLRVYLLEEPLDIPLLPEYSGCRSWIQLVTGHEERSARPVLGDSDFQARCAEIRSALQG